MAALDCVEPSCHVDVARVCFFSIIPRPPRSTLFPYTTPSRSGEGRHRLAAAVGALGGGHDKAARGIDRRVADRGRAGGGRSEEHTSELQSPDHVRCRLLLVNSALLGVGVAALDRVDPGRQGDDAGAGRRAVAPFFFNDTATTEIYPLSLHDALPILAAAVGALGGGHDKAARGIDRRVADRGRAGGGRGRRRLVADGDRDRVRVRARVIRRALLGEGGRAPWRGRGWSPGGSGSFKKK